VQGGGAEREGKDVVVLVGEDSGVAGGVVGVQLVDARNRLLCIRVARAVIPPQQVVANGVLNALQGALDDLAGAAVPQRPRSVRREVEVREQVRVDEVEREVVEPLGARQPPDRLVVGRRVEGSGSRQRSTGGAWSWSRCGSWCRLLLGRGGEVLDGRLAPVKGHVVRDHLDVPLGQRDRVLGVAGLRPDE
jgi:hypothetical protein